MRIYPIRNDQESNQEQRHKIQAPNTAELPSDLIMLQFRIPINRTTPSGRQGHVTRSSIRLGVASAAARAIAPPLMKVAGMIFLRVHPVRRSLLLLLRLSGRVCCLALVISGLVFGHGVDGVGKASVFDGCFDESHCCVELVGRLCDV
jgi:hypothetical protein